MELFFLQSVQSSIKQSSWSPIPSSAIHSRGSVPSNHACWDDSAAGESGLQQRLSFIAGEMGFCAVWLANWASYSINVSTQYSEELTFFVIYIFVKPKSHTSYHLVKSQFSVSNNCCLFAWTFVSFDLKFNFQTNTVLSVIPNSMAKSLTNKLPPQLTSPCLVLILQSLNKQQLL